METGSGGASRETECLVGGGHMRRDGVPRRRRPFVAGQSALSAAHWDDSGSIPVSSQWNQQRASRRRRQEVVVPSSSKRKGRWATRASPLEFLWGRACPLTSPRVAAADPLVQHVGSILEVLMASRRVCLITGSCTEEEREGTTAPPALHHPSKAKGVKPILVFDGGYLPMKGEQEVKHARYALCKGHERKILSVPREHEAAGNSRAGYECYQKAVDITPEIASDLIQDDVKLMGVMNLEAYRFCMSQKLYIVKPLSLDV
ncbi:hypothetical protein ACQ4PT_004419 [Festuca glaucescens]